MKHTACAKKNAVACFMLFAAIMILILAGPLQAQVSAEPPTSPDKKGIACQDIPPPGSENSSSAESAPDQASITNETCKEQADTNWATPPKESLFKKIIRVLYGPNTPPGPNTDVDTNISAGGAVGG